MIIGHSFGGKVALEYLHLIFDRTQQAGADNASQHPPHTVWLLDTIPGPLERCVGAGGLEGDAFQRVLLALAEREQQEKTKHETQKIEQGCVYLGLREDLVQEVLQQEDAPAALRCWIMSMFTAGPGQGAKAKAKFRASSKKQVQATGKADGNRERGEADQQQQQLSFDPHTAHELLVDYSAADCFPILHGLSSQPYWDTDTATAAVECAVHVMAAEESERWGGGVLLELTEMSNAAAVLSDGRPSVQVHLLPRSGHTLFTDNPKAVAECIKQHILTAK